jgi:hypothetical protein
VQRLFLALIVIAVLVAAVAVVLRTITQTVARARPDAASTKAERSMIQTGAYLALIALILGVSLGWLGGL